MTDLVEGCGVEPRLAARTRDIRDWCACSSSTGMRLSRIWRTVHEFQLGIQGLRLLVFWWDSFGYLMRVGMRLQASTGKFSHFGMRERLQPFLIQVLL